MSRYHISPSDGMPRPCGAQVGNCLFKLEDGSEPLHYDKAGADAIATSVLEKKYAPLKSVNRKNPRISDAVATADPLKVERKGRKMTDKEALLRDSVRELTERLVSVRAEVGDVAFEDANPARAKRRLREAIEFADSRGNTHLMKKLSGADVLPSGAFKLEDGSRANADKFVDQKFIVDHVEKQRESVVGALTALAVKGDVPLGAYKFKNGAATVSVTVKEGALDEDAFAKLPADVRESISTFEKKIDIDLVRAHISPTKQAQVITSSLVADKIIGKPHDLQEGKVIGRTKFVGATDEAKFNDGVQGLGELYSDARETFGGAQRDIKKESTQMANAMKSISASSNPGRNTFIPARSQKNGVIVSGRDSISRTKAAEIFTPQEIKKVTSITSVPDRAKAEKILSPEDFGRIFNARAVGIRVVEAAA